MKRIALVGFGLLAGSTSETALSTISGFVPRRSTALLPEISEPNQCIFAPVW